MNEKQLRLDLEMTLAQVRATIKAECRIAELWLNEKGFVAVLAVGEYNGLTEWFYQVSQKDLIPVIAIRVDIFAEWESANEQIEDFWAEHVERITKEFFQLNPEYRKMI